MLPAASDGMSSAATGPRECTNIAGNEVRANARPYGRSVRRVPCIGHPLPGAARARFSPDKWERWILAPSGHERDWQRVFRADADDAPAI
jgi:hypothetical protein